MYRLLIIEDEELERNALKYIIENNLKNVKIVGSTGCGEEALELNEKLDPHIILMDIQIMSMDGLKVSDRIKEKNAEKIIIVITAHDEFEFAQRAIKVKVEDYLLKPVRPEYVINAIEKNLERLEKSKLKDLITMDEDLLEDYDTIQRVIGKVTKYIDKNIKKNITLDEISEYVSMSPSYFSRTFKREMGMNFSKYIVDRKMEVAKEILRNTDIPISNIAMELAYREPNYFSKVFRKHVGITPTAFRIEYGKGNLKKNNKIVNGKWYV